MVHSFNPYSPLHSSSFPSSDCINPLIIIIIIPGLGRAFPGAGEWENKKKAEIKSQAQLCWQDSPLIKLCRQSQLWSLNTVI